jgi:D-serine deaminase-like pyridoxal phosphate-dependent protein
MKRCGIAPGQPAAELARRIADAPGLRFRGLQAYHGTAQHLPTLAERERAVGAAAEAVRATVAALEKTGLACELVTGAGTGTYRIEAMSGLWNELQAGSYLFMDTDYARIGDGNTGGRYTDFAHSLFVLATVISVPTPERAIVDAGLKSYSGEKGPPWVHGREDIEVTGVSDEHGRLQLGPKAQRLRIGDRVMLIPGHCDPTINLHDWYVAVRGRVESVWPITARGRCAGVRLSRLARDLCRLTTAAAISQRRAGWLRHNGDVITAAGLSATAFGQPNRAPKDGSAVREGFGGYGSWGGSSAACNMRRVR